MKRGLSIRLRLTLLYSVILALALGAFDVALYLSQSQSIYANIKANLVRQASFMMNPERRSFRIFQGVPNSSALPPSSELEFNLPTGILPGRWTQIRSSDGAIIGQTLDLQGASLPLSAAGLKSVQGGAGWFESVRVQDEPLLVYSLPYLAPDGAAEVVQVAFPIAQPLQSLNTLRLLLAVGSLMALLAAIALGWIAAGTALRPIQTMTHTAQAIGAERDFNRRVGHSGPTDEVGQLAITFNAMLEELESAYRQLEGALDSQRRFVADASHELRTPLTTVRGNVELLRRNLPTDPDERAEVMGDTIHEVDRLIRLVSQLLVLARADAGQTLACEPMPLDPLLEDVYRQARLLAPGRRISGPAPARLQVIGNRDALKQVLLILIDNALVHTPSSAAVEISAAVADSRVTVSVRDAGPGIRPEALPHIFERFYREQLSRSGEGAGLGLAIAKELVEAQGGSISVANEVGKGAVFSVSF